MSQEILQAALEYAALGWQVVPLYGVTPNGCECAKGKDCPSCGKHPRVNSWHLEATSDEDKILGWWERWPGSNVGVKFGKDSNLIDIECDNDKQEDNLAQMFGGEFPHTPTYKSGRGKHRLFTWRDDLPASNANGIVYVGEVGFRTGGNSKGAQSVFPPSLHHSGSQYQWIIHPSEASVAVIPDDAMARIWNWDGGLLTLAKAKPQEHWKDIAKGVTEGNRNQTAAEFIGRLLGSLKDAFNANDIEIQWDLIKAWNFKNQPPLSHAELEQTFKSILRRERGKRTNSDHSEETSPQRPWGPEQDGIEPPVWKLVIVESKPRTYKLFSPLWSAKAPFGYIVLDANQMHNPEVIRREALEQADVWVNRSFSKLWNGDKDNESLARKLVESASYEHAPIEDRRDLMVAELLWEQLERAQTIEEGKQPGSLRPSKLPDGSIVFKFSKVLEPLSLHHKIKPGELSQVLKSISAREQNFGARHDRRKLKLLSPKSINSLRRMIGVGDEEGERLLPNIQQAKELAET